MLRQKLHPRQIARRLERILPDLIHPNQNGFIKGRSIQDGVRTIEDILEFARFTDRSGILLVIDFEKAFDFPVRGGVRQGDLLLPLLFILAPEILACQIREDNGIRGIFDEEEEIKLTLFADGMTCFLRDMVSCYRLMVTL